MRTSEELYKIADEIDNYRDSNIPGESRLKISIHLKKVI